MFCASRADARAGAPPDCSLLHNSHRSSACLPRPAFRRQRLHTPSGLSAVCHAQCKARGGARTFGAQDRMRFVFCMVWRLAFTDRSRTAFIHDTSTSSLFWACIGRAGSYSKRSRLVVSACAQTRRTRRITFSAPCRSQHALQQLCPVSLVDLACRTRGERVATRQQRRSSRAARERLSNLPV